MKHVLFFLLSKINGAITKLIKDFAEMSMAISTGTTCHVMKLIDHKRMEHAESIADQIDEIKELQILHNINEIRNDAVKIGKWNEDHETQLNFLGNLLYNECDWEVEQVERYLHEVIETGPEIMAEE